MVTISVQAALQYAADKPEPDTDIVLDQHAYELVARTLFDIASAPDSRVRGSMVRATRAQRLILNRLVGTRRPGSHPVATSKSGVTFIDLAAGSIE